MPAFAALTIAAALPAVAIAADDAAPEAWNAKFQSTYIWQNKSSMRSPYSGPNSLSGDREKSYSFTATAAIGVRPWRGGEIFFDGEGAQGVPLSDLTGLGGFTNGEMARSSGANLRLYRARFFARQTLGLGGGQDEVDSDANQLAGKVDRDRIVFTLGNVSAIDIFDRNAYSHDPRTQFMNWSLMTHGAYDFAADARGYTTGAAVEWLTGDWAWRIGRFAIPKLPNQQELDDRILKHYGDQIELEHAHRIAGQPGRVRLLASRMKARMSRFDDAIALGQQTGNTPDINEVRTGDRIKTGWGLSLEQQLRPDLGAFARYSRSDGKTETYAFTEIDRSFSGGLSLDGNAWGRGGDTVGVGFARNELSKQRRAYLAQGGISFFIGDGRLNYSPELVGEVYYRLQVYKKMAVTLDFQRIVHPAYNADRGPVNFAALRLHAEF